AARIRIDRRPRPRPQCRQRRRAQRDGHGRRHDPRGRDMKRPAALLAAVLLALLPQATEAASRIKDIATLQTVRDNQLVGYGLVIGLQGSGDSLRNSPFTEQSIRAMLQNLGIATEGGQARSKNVAAVIVTANLPPYIKIGGRIDITVSSM